MLCTRVTACRWHLICYTLYCSEPAHRKLTFDIIRKTKVVLKSNDRRELNLFPRKSNQARSIIGYNVLLDSELCNNVGTFTRTQFRETCLATKTFEVVSMVIWYGNIIGIQRIVLKSFRDLIFANGYFCIPFSGLRWNRTYIQYLFMSFKKK